MENLYRIALTLLPGVGPRIGRKLLEYFGSATAIFTASKRDLQGLPEIPVNVANVIGKKTPLIRAERELEFVTDQKVNLFFLTDPSYPKRLRRCEDAPLLLYYWGNADLDAAKIVSVIGTRNATNYGRSVCNDLLKAIRPYAPVIVSGMAYGIDSYAHQGALNNELPTIGVLGHGLDRMYPQAHIRLAEKMLENGGLLTEFPSQTPPERQNFPMRNRIIAGIADVVVVVEAPNKGGSLITASIANTYHRDVGAVPGNIYQEFSEGCNHLIKTHRAFPITSAADIAYQMNWEIPTSPTINTPDMQITEEERYILAFLREHGAQSIQSISESSGLTLSRLPLTLLQMELKKMITKLPGNRYTIKGQNR